MKVTHRPPLPAEDTPGTHFFQKLSRPQGHSASGKIEEMKDPTDTVGNQTHAIPACIAVPQPTAQRRAPIS